MARINYGALTEALRVTIEEDENVINAGATVECGRAPTIALGMTPHVGVYERPRVPANGQTIGAGRFYRLVLNWELWVTVISGKDYLDAVNQRDDLLSWIEIALMRNRSLKGALANSPVNLGGGDLRSGPGPSGFVAEGSITLSAEVEAIA